MTEATISRNSISIRIPVKRLQGLVEGTWSAGRLSERVNLTDPEEFARGLVDALNAEDESGANMIDTMIDAAVGDALEGGAEGFEIHKSQAA